MLNIDGSELAKRIDAFCAMNGVSKDTLAKETGISSASLSQWRTGINNPSMKKIRALENFTKIPIEEFLSDDGPSNNRKKETPVPMNERQAYWAERINALSPPDQVLVGAVLDGFRDNPEAMRAALGLALRAAMPSVPVP